MLPWEWGAHKRSGVTGEVLFLGLSSDCKDICLGGNIQVTHLEDVFFFSPLFFYFKTSKNIKNIGRRKKMEYSSLQV